MYLMHFNDYCHYIFLPFLFFWNSILNCTLFLKFQKRDKESQNFSNFIFHFQLFSSIFFLNSLQIISCPVSMKFRARRRISKFLKFLLFNYYYYNIFFFRNTCSNLFLKIRARWRISKFLSNERTNVCVHR